mmetsp:Transcript_6214/g.8682  ORF Transcript_6214/g.8682 Transcript_6214/m.8682 type:complete len:89 (+) Transcript_6214:2-268(+)
MTVTEGEWEPMQVDHINTLKDERINAWSRYAEPPQAGCFGKCCNGGFKTEAPEAFLADSPDAGVIVEQGFAQAHAFREDPMLEDEAVR